MEPRAANDPRHRPLEPTAEETAAWAEREQRRRRAWLGGPSELEQEDWARRHRRRAWLGLEESRLGPTAEEVERWAERERARRKAWLDGPSEAERREWARSWRWRAMSSGESELPPTPEEVEAWATQEQERRRQWAAGPTEAERQRWARRQARGLAGGWGDASMGAELPGLASRLLHEAELASKGSFRLLVQAPFAAWSRLVHEGRSWEEEMGQQPRRGRVRY